MKLKIAPSLFKKSGKERLQKKQNLNLFGMSFFMSLAFHGGASHLCNEHKYLVEK
ncbi:unknown protein [Microcystis aeruginosa NIES-843]|uniref:Uncharacterized protein n=1 Tax=Microcystis aeruginosa (strain NIES-843 / IAM M-2473) TaxID=449447 RepID=B0JLR0_MICAN|nr:unknown protein [Microcystis aeruginosa NIES-843]